MGACLMEIEGCSRRGPPRSQVTREDPSLHSRPGSPHCAEASDNFHRFNDLDLDDRPSRPLAAELAHEVVHIGDRGSNRASNLVTLSFSSTDPIAHFVEVVFRHQSHDASIHHEASPADPLPGSDTRMRKPLARNSHRSATVWAWHRTTGGTSTVDAVA